MKEFFKEYLQFLKEQKKMFLVPIFLMLVLLSSLIFFSTSSTVTPFIYTLFWYHDRSKQKLRSHFKSITDKSWVFVFLSKKQHVWFYTWSVFYTVILSQTNQNYGWDLWALTQTNWEGIAEFVFISFLYCYHFASLPF